MNRIKEGLKKFWNFIWKEDSLLGWITFIILALLLVRFIIYPGLGLTLGTNLPVVAVISESMQHDAKFDDWWNSPAQCERGVDQFVTCTQAEWYLEHNITKEEFENYPLKNGFNKGDIIILKGSDYSKMKQGDVIVFQSSLAYPIIHRIVEKGNTTVQTKGDHNPRQIVDTRLYGLNEKNIPTNEIIGKAWIKIPAIGYIKIWFVDLARCVTFNGCTFE